jgi:hypothetical protein
MAANAAASEFREVIERPMRVSKLDYRLDCRQNSLAGKPGKGEDGRVREQIMAEQRTGVSFALSWKFAKLIRLHRRVELPFGKCGQT